MNGVAPLCGFCKEAPTRHHCMHPVHEEGIHIDGVGGHVCSELICAPCSSFFRNKDGIFHCLEYSNSDAVDDIDKDNDGISAGESMSVPQKKKKNKVASKAALKKGKSSSESDDATETTSGVTPCDGAMGMNEEIILDNVCRSIQTSDANNSASAVLGTALGEFTALISESLKSWQSHQAYMNADPVLKRKYNDLLLMENIHKLEKSAASRCVGNSTTIGPFSTPIGVAMLLPFHSTKLQEIIMIGWYLIL